MASFLSNSNCTLLINQNAEAYYLGLEMRPGLEIGPAGHNSSARSILFEAAPADDCLIFWYNHERDVSERPSFEQWGLFLVVVRILEFD